MVKTPKKMETCQAQAIYDSLPARRLIVALIDQAKRDLRSVNDELSEEAFEWFYRPIAKQLAAIVDMDGDILMRGITLHMMRGEAIRTARRISSKPRACHTPPQPASQQSEQLDLFSCATTALTCSHSGYVELVCSVSKLSISGGGKRTQEMAFFGAAFTDLRQRVSWSHDGRMRGAV